jgi:hypothetical protein
VWPVPVVEDLELVQRVQQVPLVEVLHGDLTTNQTRGPPTDVRQG